MVRALAPHRTANPENCRLEIVYESSQRSMCILLLDAIGANLIGPYGAGGLQVENQAIERESRYTWNDSCVARWMS